MTITTRTSSSATPTATNTPTATPSPTATSVPPTTTRTISYSYDGLLRLTGAVESSGTSYSYGYDLAGNRTSVTVNGAQTQSFTYNAANQITNTGYSYDAAGNLTTDGTTTYTYDALNRMTTRGSVTYSYNGDGVLVYDGVTRYTQDLVSPLSQILGDGGTNYIYGLDRLAAQNGSTKTWYGTDALGSVRMTLDDAGAPLDIITYDPWGTVESGSVPTFGFTGELHGTTVGLVNLRARWYSTTRGTFTTVDPFAGMPEQPYSLHHYQYAYADPVLLTDPSGKNPFPMGPVDPLEGVYIGAVVAATFMAGKPGDRWAEYPVPGASTNRLNAGDFRINGFADLVDFSNGEVYEVKARGKYQGARAETVRQLEGYVDGLNYAAKRTGSSIEEWYRPAPATGTWMKGTTFLSGGVQSFGLWPFGIDPTYDPKLHGYYEIKAKMSPDTGIIIYWGEKISDVRARQLAPRYMPEEILKLVEVMYKDPYGRNGNKNWRMPNWGTKRPQLYPGMNVFDAGYWCSVTGDMIKHYYEELGRLGNQLDPVQPGTVPGIPGPGYIPVVP